MLAFFSSANAASFDCQKAESEAEILICNDEELSQIDTEFDKLYQKARSITSNLANFDRDAKEAWLKREQNCDDKICLIIWYRDRMEKYSMAIHKSIPENNAPTTTNVTAKLNDYTTAKNSNYTQTHGIDFDSSGKLNIIVGFLIFLIIIYISKSIPWSISIALICLFIDLKYAITSFLILSLICIYIAHDRNKRQKDHQARIQNAISQIEKLIDLHKDKLTIQRKQLSPKRYGIHENSKWLKEKDFFIQHVIMPEFYEIFEEINEKFNIEYEIDLATNNFANSKIEYAIMNPLDYEQLIADKLSSYGWATETTKATGDQGADVIAEKNGKRVVVQCKWYSNPVGNDAVQQVISGRFFYNAQYAVVVSNSRFTASAHQIAQSSNVILMHHDELRNLVEIIETID